MLERKLKHVTESKKLASTAKSELEQTLETAHSTRLLEQETYVNYYNWSTHKIQELGQSREDLLKRVHEAQDQLQSNALVKSRLENQVYIEQELRIQQNRKFKDYIQKLHQTYPWLAQGMPVLDLENTLTSQNQTIH